MKIRPAAGGIEIGFPAAKPKAALDVALQVADALVLSTVVVGGGRDTRLHTGLMEGITGRVAAKQTDVHGPMFAARAVAFGIGLDALEIGQDFLVAPTGIAEIAPVVVFGRLTPHPQHPVDRRGTTENAAAWPKHLAVAEIGLRFRVETPQTALRQ